MRQMGARFLGLGGALALLGGCSQQTINSAQHDVQHDAAAVTQAAQKAALQAQPQLHKAGMGARVTAALQAADVHGVRVDAGPDGVTLVGQANSRADKERILRIAHETLGPGKIVRSRIMIAGQP